jgi:hypothetical protein
MDPSFAEAWIPGSRWPVVPSCSGGGGIITSTENAFQQCWSQHLGLRFAAVFLNGVMVTGPT